MATIRDIANKVGVSPATVSGVLNNNSKLSVSNETRSKIIYTAKQMNYKKRIAAPLVTKIAFLYWISEMTELEDVYFKKTRQAVEEQIGRRQIELVEITKEEGIDAVPHDIEGIIAIGAFTSKELKTLQSLTSNVVFIDSSPNDDIFDSVAPDLRKITMKIVHFFIKEGHTHIGMLGMHDVDLDAKTYKRDPREESFRYELDKQSLLSEEFIFIREKASFKEGYNGMMEAIDILGDRLPTAFFVATDALAVGALQALNEKDIKVPYRVSVFSINNISVSNYVSPPLTTYEIDNKTLVNTAFELLNSRVSDKRKVPLKVLMSCKPVFRRSTKLKEG